MNSRHSFMSIMVRAARELTALLCLGVLTPGTSALAATQTQLPDAPSAQAPAKIPPDQLDSLVAPIALYPDPMLSQTLVASTYPLEVIQLKQWMDQHEHLGDKALADAVKKQDWDQRQQWLEIDGFEIGTRESRSIVPTGGQAEYFSSHDVEQIGFGPRDRGQADVPQTRATVTFEQPWSEPAQWLHAAGAAAKQ